CSAWSSHARSCPVTDLTDRVDPAAKGLGSSPRPSRPGMVANDGPVPALVEQTAVREDALPIAVAEHAERAAAQMLVAAQPLIAARGHLPAGLPDPVREIRFVPLRRDERLVEVADPRETRASHGPGSNDGIHFLEAEPVPGKRADRA